MRGSSVEVGRSAVGLSLWQVFCLLACGSADMAVKEGSEEASFQKVFET
eukprot:CAMPEP_0171208996 /NCGR_PEP_ID=MMETSP0790-20130122/28372_1 /TAXON_ID=2925 /ORGANISM="Alexandrium catenella, Strain OF101" /LENGTH=48 /DNA_ID= /DNA_START= /DNA_END= /DNA_ORIENTATION=